MLKARIITQLTLISALMLQSTALWSDGNTFVSTFDTIHISADVAREDIRPGIMHFEGRFILKSAEWWLESARATVYGQLERPDHVHLEGSPARFVLIGTKAGRQHNVEASAPLVEYQRSTDTLILSGGAVLKLDDEVVTSSVIKYNMVTENYQAEGVDGVNIEIPTGS